MGPQGAPKNEHREKSYAQPTGSAAVFRPPRGPVGQPRGPQRPPGRFLNGAKVGLLAPQGPIYLVTMPKIDQIYLWHNQS